MSAPDRLTYPTSEDYTDSGPPRDWFIRNLQNAPGRNEPQEAA